MTIQGPAKLRSLTLSALAAAVLCVVSPWTLSIGPIPLSLCSLFLYLLPYVTGWKQSCAAAAVYVLLGCAGLPVFSAFTGGLGVLAGPTGGYILGYLLLALIFAQFLRLFPASRLGQLIGMVLGTAVLYALGTAWYCFQSGTGPAAAVLLCVVPFLPGDIFKMAFALTLGPTLHHRLKKAGLIAR